MNNIPQTISKVLSSNDCGETKAHQAGPLIPKQGGVLDFFPRLDPTEYNPRVVIVVRDETDKYWKLNFIYYNSKLHGNKKGRNEYRLTGMTRYIKQNNLVAGDTITLTHMVDGDISISYKRTSSETGTTNKSGTIKLGSSWSVITC